ncbi:hemerythrin domain-containing protein [Herbaspirillum sp. ST 5-3]|uniref:hemerythrin domain-containing protein n=1 Tax=Oxalobacteraceae TaxID=75682 RepID=UPI001455F946|nr:hemerythrin domain-containing protein [Herbaspirillum sp. ST 5-3]
MPSGNLFDLGQAVPNSCHHDIRGSLADLEIPISDQGDSTCFTVQIGRSHGVHVMDTICGQLGLDHKHCDLLFAQIGTCLRERNWEDAHTRFLRFSDAIKQHIRMEEKVLFPVFEQTIRHGAGPIEMLRQEHQQLRCIVDRMFDALINFHPADFLLHAESYTLLMQQHCVKEEMLVYPLLDKVAAEQRAQIVHAMTEYSRAIAPSGQSEITERLQSD